MPDKRTKTHAKLKDVNPRVHNVDIGIRTLRKVPIYPLSVADQLEMTDLITEAVGTFFSLEAEKMKEGPPVEFVIFMFELIKTNISELIVKLTGEEDSDAILSDMDNNQLAEIVDIVYKENFELPLARIVALFQKDQTMEVESILEKLQPQSAGSTDTDSNTSSDEATGKEE